MLHPLILLSNRFRLHLLCFIQSEPFSIFRLCSLLDSSCAHACSVYPCGKVCLSILDPSKAWRPSITLKTILSGVQELLDTPNNDDAAQAAAYNMYKHDQEGYKRKVRQQARQYAAQ